MRTFTFCFLLTLGCFINSISAQSDSLITALEKTLQAQIDALGEEHLDVAMFCDSLGVMYKDAGKYAKADSLFTKALEIKVKKLEKNHPEIADSYYNIGRIYRYTGDYTQADSLSTKALNIRLDVFGEKHVDVATSYNSLGIIYDLTGDYEKADSFYRKALNIRIDVFGEKHSDVASSYNNLGLIHRKTGDHEKAINFYNKALNIGLEILGENHPNVGVFYNNLGTIYWQTGDYEKVISLQNKALNIWLETFGEKHPRIASSYNNLGNAYDKIGDHEKVITLHDKALNIWLETFGEKHHRVASSYNSLGLVYYGTGDYKKAISFHDKALNIRLEVFGEKHPDVAESYLSLGLAYFQTSDYEKASSFYGKALNIRLEVFGKKHPYVDDCHINLSMVNEAIGNYSIADSLWRILIPNSIKHLKSSYLLLPTDQRVKYSGTFSQINNDFYSFAANNGFESTRQLATNYLLNIKSLTLDYGISTNKLIQEINDTTLSHQHQQFNQLSKQLANAETLTIEERKEKGWDLSNIQEERDNIAFQMLQHPQLKSKLNTETIEWQDVQNRLTLDEATIDFIEVNEKQDSIRAYYAIVIHKDLASPQFVRITDVKTIVKLLETDKNERPDYLSERGSRKALHKVFWQPLEPYLEGVKTVHISPSGILHRVPFESLQDEENDYLATQYDFHYYSAIRDMLKDKSRKNTYKDMVVMGHILYDLDNKDKYEEEEDAIAMVDEKRNIRDGILPLPGTLKEVKKIGRTGKKAGIKTTLLTIDTPSEDTVQYFVRERAPNIFHFATHGVFLPRLEKQDQGDGLIVTQDRLRAAENPLQRSALMLYGANETWTKGRPILGSGEDGILTALEVTALDLQNTDLVVLSACSTGLGNVHNTEGVFGLQRAFKLAGVNYVVASLWDVDDVATKDLMVKFYKNLLEEKQDPATALRNAKNHFRDKGYEPADWAGFILIE